MRVSTASMFRQGVDTMLAQSARVQKAQLQVSTGRRIQVPSDDPAGAKRLMDLDNALRQSRQYQANADVAEARLGLEDSVLASAGNILQRIRELGLQANGGALSNSDRASIATEIGVRLDELLGVSNQRDSNGEYLFSGTATRTRPFATQVGGGYTYNGNQMLREIAIAADYRLPVSHSGDHVFVSIPNGNRTFAVDPAAANTGSGVIDPGAVTDPSAWVPDTYTISFVTDTDYEVRDSSAALVTSGTYVSGETIAFNGVETHITGTPLTGDAFTVAESTNRDVFSVVAGLEAALRVGTNDGQSRAVLDNAINRAIVDIDRAMDRIREVRSDAGARFNALDSERALQEDFDLHVQTVISDVRDLDLAEGVSRLAQESSLLEASQAAFARVQGLSLFQFL